MYINLTSRARFWTRSNYSYAIRTIRLCFFLYPLCADTVPNHRSPQNNRCNVTTVVRGTEADVSPYLLQHSHICSLGPKMPKVRQKDMKLFDPNPCPLSDGHSCKLFAHHPELRLQGCIIQSTIRICRKEIILYVSLCCVMLFKIMR